MARGGKKKKGGKFDDDDDDGDDDNFVDPIKGAGKKQPQQQQQQQAKKQQPPQQQTKKQQPEQQQGGGKKAAKKGGGKFRDSDKDDDDSDDDNDDDDGGKKKGPNPAAAKKQQQGAVNRKGGKKNKGGKAKGGGDDDSDDSGADHLAALISGKTGAGSDDDDDSDDGKKVKNKPPPPPQKKGKQQSQPAKSRGHVPDSDHDSESSSGDGDRLVQVGGKKNRNKNNSKKKIAPKQPSSNKDDLDSDDEEDDDEDDDHQPPKNNVGAKKALIDNDEEDSTVPSSAPGGKNKKGSGITSGAVVVSSENETDKDDYIDDEENDNDAEPVQQVAAVMVDDDWGLGGTSKKNKKDKKEKKEKKDKKKKIEVGKEEGHEAQPLPQQAMNSTDLDNNNSNNPIHITTTTVQQQEEESDSVPVLLLKEPKEKTSPVVEAETVAAPPPQQQQRVKSKFELQMEAAMSKSKEAKKDVIAPAPPAPVVVETKPAKEENPPNDEKEQEEEEPVEMYGIGDGTSMGNKPEEDDDDPNNENMFGPDGKKLSNRDRKKMRKAQEAAVRAAEFERAAAVASREGAQFACSQTAVDENDALWQNALDINIPSFSISAAGKVLFKDALLSISHGRRYGLVGPNGKGKSTLLKMMASKDLKLPPRIDFLYVEQEVVADDTPAVEAVLKADVRRWELLEEEKRILQAVDAAQGDEDVSWAQMERLQVIGEELSNMGSDAAEARARRILFGLGFAMDVQTKPTKMFSGGWRMRISLARALFVEPTLLMLDEPTNHLDLNAVIWLEEYLKKWKKTLLVVSHDQDFLNSVCDEVLHIENLKLCSYKGNYDSFKKAERIKFEQELKAWEKQEKRLRELKKSGQMSKQKAQEAVKKQSALKREAGPRAQKKKNQAVASGSEAVEATELIQRPREYQVKFEFAEVNPLARPVMEVNSVHFRYSPKHPVIFEKVDFGIDMDSRITIVGPNGAGKSTLLKLLTGEVDPTRGEVKRNPRLRMGIYNQHFVDKLPMDKTPVEFLRDKFQDQDYQSVRNRLGKYGLEGHAHEVKMRDLSGGQKARVVFVELSLEQPHILLLDEPTNNLDIESIDALCDAINGFNGGVVVVTHDQRLIDECQCTLWVVEKLGVTEWTAGFEDYKSSILDELEREVERENQARMAKLQLAAEARAEKLAQLAKRMKK